ncbi:hypothetical protein COOONC_00018 [Cooperia oncophora]
MNCNRMLYSVMCQTTWESSPLHAECQAPIQLCLKMLLAYNTVKSGGMCACCCKQFLLHPLTLAAIGASISLATAVVVYGLKNQTAFEGVKDWKSIETKITSEVGYSFWLAAGALVLAIVDVIVGTCAVCMGESCL